jgi:hypothetical protein
MQLFAAVEYACDLADYSAAFIPFGVREAAAATARWDMMTYIVQTVPFYCGSTRPMWTKDPFAIPPSSIPRCLDPNRVDCGGQGSMGLCDSTMFKGCGADGCCVPMCARAATDPTAQCTGLGGFGFSCIAGPGATCDPQSGCCNVPPKPLKVSATMTFTGPRICIHGEGFESGQSVQVQYLNVPDGPNGNNQGLNGTSGSPRIGAHAEPVGTDGQFTMRDESQINAFTFNLAGCTDLEMSGDVTVQAVQSGTSGLFAEGKIQSNIWCHNAFPATNINGGCP